MEAAIRYPTGQVCVFKIKDIVRRDKRQRNQGITSEICEYGLERGIITLVQHYGVVYTAPFL